MLLLFRGLRAISSLAAATTIQKAGWLRKSTVLAGGACFQLSHTLFYTIKARESLLAVGADVGVHDLELGGDVLDGGGETDDGVTGFVVAAAEAHSPHRSNAYGCAGYCGDELYHSGSGTATPKRKRWRLARKPHRLARQRSGRQPAAEMWCRSLDVVPQQPTDDAADVGGRHAEACSDVLL